MYPAKSEAISLLKSSLIRSNLYIFRKATMFANNTSANDEEFKELSGDNGTCFLAIDHVAVMTSYITIYSILLLASLTGNTLLIYASVKSNIRMGLILANIAVSDILYSIFHFPREMVTYIKASTAFQLQGWIGHVVCKICTFVTDVTIAVSTLSLVLVAADRLVAVVFPATYIQITVKKRRLLILSTWIVAMAIHSPYFYTFRLETINGETFCISNWEPAFNHESTSIRYYTALLVTVLIVPLITVCILQALILVKLRSDKLALSRTCIANQRRTERNKKLLKMSVMIALAFALTWFPFVAYQLLHLHFPSSIPHCSLGFRIFSQFVFLLSLCHCLVNPCISFKFMHRVRIVLKPGRIR